MNLLNKFLLLSNSKYAGQTTCKYLNTGVYSGKDYNGFCNVFKNNDLSSIKERIQRHNVAVFKPPLEEIYNPPIYLYKKGRGVLKPSVAIIGARSCSSYGQKMAYKIAYELGKRDIQVISGLAYGIDIMAHRGALDAGGSTVAVLGSGILNCYPSSHKNEYDEIQKKGLIISEYGLDSKPLKHHFPFRNRLISGLAQVVVVVEAKEKSGTMITVNYGLDQGKTIIAVPGPADSVYSMGTNRLIKEGAQIYTCIEDILNEGFTRT